MLYIYVEVISLLLYLICIIKPWFALVLIIYLYIISWIRCHSLHVIFYFQEIVWKKWVYRSLWENGGQTRIKEELKDHAWMSKEVQLECLGHLPCMEALNKEKKNQRGRIWKGKILFEYWSVFWTYLSPKKSNWYKVGWVVTLT